MRIFAVLLSPGGSPVDSGSVIHRWRRTLKVTGAEVCVLLPALSSGSAAAPGPGGGWGVRGSGGSGPARWSCGVLAPAAT